MNIPKSPEEPAHLSAGQARLWFLQQMAPESALYNLHIGIRMKGPLDEAALLASLAALITRHEALRSTFPEIDGELRVVIEPTPPEWEMPVIDLRGLAPHEREAALPKLSAELSAERFNLRRGPLTRTTLVKLSDDEHILFLTQHHIISDGWSLVILARDLAEIYRSRRAGEAPKLPELAAHYSDYVRRQAAERDGDVAKESESWWRRALAGLPRLELPAPEPAQRRATRSGAARSFALSADLTSKLKGLARRERCTLFVALLSLWAALLHRYCQQVDFGIGTITAARGRSPRDRRERRDLVGFFANTIIIRCDLSGDPSFAALLGRVRDFVKGALHHEDLPFDRVVSAVDAPRGRDLNPLVRATFVLQTEAISELAIPEMVWTPVLSRTDAGAHGSAKFDIGLSMLEAEGGLKATIEYMTDLWDAEGIERLAKHFEVLAEGAVAEPSRPVSELPLLTAEERRTLLREWNDTAAALPAERRVHELFEAQAQKEPDAVAVAFGERRLTYRELDERANQLAHYLRSMGVGAAPVIGIAVDRSLEMVLAILGVWKAGGAYVPLDPSYPLERLSFMMEDAQIAVLLTEERIAASMPAHAARVFCVDSGASILAAQPITAPPPPSTDDDLAQILYTSGSTGKPKGVEITHGSLVNLLLDAAGRITISAQDRMLAVNSLSFDISGLDLFMPLLAGASVEIAPRMLGMDGPALRRHLERSGITIMQTTPSRWQLLLDAGWEGDPSFKLLTGGETLTEELRNKIVVRVGEAWNGYGPTETTIYSCFQKLTATSGPPPIGRPIANTRVYVLDRKMQLLPVGVPGELYIGGAGLARGYHDRPDLSAARFLTDALSEEPGARMYKTGDLVRWRRDGALEFLGRLDHQVKLRGFRIELGEIESALARHPEVLDAVVVLREDTPGQKRLVAYLVAREAPIPGAAALRSYLQTKLPEFMIPAAFVELPLMPLSPNGKVNRSALPAPDEAIAINSDAPLPPRTPAQEVIGGIWADVLHIDRVGLEDNFFDLGGHSLLAAQVQSRLRRAFGVDLPLAALFEAPTVALLSDHIEAALRAGAPRALPPLALSPREEPIPLSFAQERLWFLDQLEPNSSIYNMPSATRLSGPLDARALEQSLREIVRRHEALRSAFPVTLGQPRQVIEHRPGLAMPILDLSSLTEPDQRAEVARRAAEEAGRPFDLSRGPLFRAALLRLGEEEHVLLLTIHHIAADGWSIGVLTRELAALYEAFSQNRPSPLGALPVQYADYAVWQRQRLTGEPLEAQLHYWRGALRGAPAALDLPTDRPRPPAQTHRGAAVPVEIPREIGAALAALSRREGVTLFMTLLAAFQLLLHRTAGQDDIVVGSPIAGRTDPALEDLVGFFVNTIALRADLSGAPTFLELLARTREVTLGAYAHQDVPFEKLAFELAPPRDLQRTPLFQAMFALQNTPAPTLRLGALSLTPLDIEVTTAKFEITLSLVEVDSGLRGALEYNTDLFDRSTAERMVAHYRALLAAIVAEPDRRVSELSMIADEERRLLLGPWSGEAASYTLDRCVHELFEAQAERTPHVFALELGEQTLTYRELDVRANQLAHHLRSAGVKADTLVGLCVDRSFEMVIGLLAIFKAGGAYVPLDPRYPRERLSFMLDDARPPVLLSQSWLRDCLPANTAHIVHLDAEAATLTSLPATPPRALVKEADLAYVLYTSGSTGRPKGVMMPHRALTNLLQWQIAEDPGLSRAAILQFTSLNFDVSLQEIFGALLTGGRLVLLPEEHRNDVRAVAKLVASGRCDTLFGPQSLLSALAEELISSEAPPRLRRFYQAGEALELTEPVATLFRRIPSARLINHYGPTETHVATSFAVPPVDAPLRPPIGRAIANMRVYVLDAHRQPTPVGVRGELYIGGAGVARGYLDREELTAERFLPDPFSGAPDARMYRTGDLVRWLPDGELEYLGRRDHQVKIRGVRIELGEIESALGQHPAIREVAVAAREDTPGEKRLIAYLVAREAPLASAAALRRHLQATLPEPMIPAAFVELSALPRSPNGKLDRAALPAPDLALCPRDRARVPPETPLERSLVALFARVLGVPEDRVGVDDDFFEIGGDSLKAARLGACAWAAVGHEIPLKILFQRRTTRALAAELSAQASLLDASPGSRPAPSSAPPTSRGSFMDDDLLNLILTRRLPALDATALGYLPFSLFHERTGMSKERLRRTLRRRDPSLWRVAETPIGRVGIIVLPILDTDLYSESGALMESVLAALTVSKEAGAAFTSLTGLIPSATDYGRAIVPHIDPARMTSITTGHSATCSAVVLCIQRVLSEGGRTLSGEAVAFVGLGSIGSSTLRLMLSVLPHPRRLLLVDTRSKLPELEALKGTITDDLGYRGDVLLLSSGDKAPSEVYDATLVVGATNQPEVLDVERLRPGAMVIDDSAPFIISEEKARRRFLEARDILFAEAGSLHLPSPIHWRRNEALERRQRERFPKWSAEPSQEDELSHRITGCVFSSLLPSRCQGLSPVVGRVRLEDSIAHYRELRRMGILSPDLSTSSFRLDAEGIRAFRERFSSR